MRRSPIFLRETGLALSAKRGTTLLYPVLLACMILLSVYPLSAKSWRITDFHDTIAIGQDGNTVVSERLNIQFEGEWHGIHRTIPVEYPGPRGTNYKLFLDVRGGSDGEGNKLKY